LDHALQRMRSCWSCLLPRELKLSTIIVNFGGTVSPISQTSPGHPYSASECDEMAARRQISQEAFVAFPFPRVPASKSRSPISIGWRWGSAGLNRTNLARLEFVSTLPTAWPSWPLGYTLARKRLCICSVKAPVNR